MLSFLFLRYLSGNYEESAKKELGADYPQLGDSECLFALHELIYLHHHPQFLCSLKIYQNHEK
jgi:hypothetical protein